MALALTGDPGVCLALAVALRRYDAVLADLDARLAEALAHGLPPEEYEKCERLKEANVVARKVLRLAAAPKK